MMPSVPLLAGATLALLGIGTLVLTSFALLPTTAQTARAAFPILLTEIVIVGSAVASFWTGGVVLSLAVAGLVWRVSYEVAAIAQRDIRMQPALFASGVLAIAITGSFLPISLLLGIAGITAALLLLFIGRHGWNSVFGVLLFPTLPLLIFSRAALDGGYGAWLLLAFLLVETFDSYALLGGKLFGQTKAFPVLSPRKTVEGLAIGAAMLMATAGCGAWLVAAPFWPAIGLAALTAPLAVAGDLAASRIKRAQGVKDYPAVLPLQGGLFDITDSWITTGAGFVLLTALV